MKTRDIIRPILVEMSDEDLHSKRVFADMSFGYSLCCKYPFLSDEWIAGHSLLAEKNSQLIDRLGDEEAQKLYDLARAEFEKHGMAISLKIEADQLAKHFGDASAQELLNILQNDVPEVWKEVLKDGFIDFTRQKD